jgi:hypothetical protein
MPYLTVEKLREISPKTAAISADIVTECLNTANAYAFGRVKGTPPADMDLSGLWAAVALAFDIFAKDKQKGAVNPDTGNITVAAPAGFFVQKEDNPLSAVDIMLAPYAEAVRLANTTKSDRGIMFL